MMKSMRKILKNSYAFSLITKVTLVFFGVLNTVFINRYLGPELKGQYEYILNIINIAVLILNLGVYQSYPYKKRTDDQGDIREKYFAIIIVQFLAYVVISIIVSASVKMLEVTFMTMLISIMILTKQLMFISMIENINLRNLLNIGNQILYTIMLLIVFIVAPQNIYYLFVVLLLKDILIITRIIRSFSFKLSKRSFDFKLLVDATRFGFYPMITALLITMNYRFDIIILRSYVEFSQIGLYTVGVGLADKLWIIPDAFKDVLFAKTAIKNSIDDINMSIKINIIISVFMITFIAIFGKPIIKFLYGEDFIAAYSVTIIILIGIIPMLFFKLINTLFISVGKQKISFIVLLISVILNIIGNIVMIPIYGIVGAAYASIISYFICGISFLLYYSRIFNVKLWDILIFSKCDINRIKVFKR
ncbi:putative polysaccharide biosynthesis protein [Natranaerovirga pectinivora]|uniref:Putative polysaccharide biosynthesis protein n=1 Tax=Natranaerovirga pectinivora TaxID=682400 RepID=A0A4R3MKA0_9FIRM|nr:polysaccharide biosynthesis C-terminal domain-containing protein [Natranaerovirga pectinivora]TCT12853.1 putative polysaccharide biosynthesis protein [Natranaerovirga pectinivora]